MNLHTSQYNETKTIRYASQVGLALGLLPLSLNASVDVSRWGQRTKDIYTTVGSCSSLLLLLLMLLLILLVLLLVLILVLVMTCEFGYKHLISMTILVLRVACILNLIHDASLILALLKSFPSWLCIRSMKIVYIADSSVALVEYS